MDAVRLSLLWCEITKWKCLESFFRVRTIIREDGFSSPLVLGLSQILESSIWESFNMKSPQWELLLTASLITLTVWLIPSNVTKVKQEIPLQVTQVLTNWQVQTHSPPPPN